MNRPPYLALMPVLLVVVAAVAHAGSVPPADDPAPPTWVPGGSIVLDDRGTELRLKTTDPGVGLPIVLRLEIAWTDEARPPAIRWPGVDAELGEFEVIGTSRRNQATVPGTPLVSTWAVRTFASGDVELPSFGIRVDQRILEVPARTIAISSIAGTDTDPAAHRDITGPVEVDVATPGRWIPFVVAAVILLGVVALLIWWLRRPRPIAPPIPADTWALERLHELETRGHLRAGRIHRFYVELTDITRRFIELRYRIAAPERTTPEFVLEATRHPEIDTEHARILGNLLQAADMVKFAGDRPASAEAERHLGFVRGFVNEVGPQPPEEKTTGISGADTAPAAAGADEGKIAARESRIRKAVDGLDQIEEES